MANNWIIFDFDGTLNNKNPENKTEFNPTISLETFNELRGHYKIGIITNSKIFPEKYENMKQAGYEVDGFIYRENENTRKKPDLQMYEQFCEKYISYGHRIMLYIGNDPIKDGELANKAGIKFVHTEGVNIKDVLANLIKDKRQTFQR